MSNKKNIWKISAIVILTLIAGFILGSYFSNKAVGRRLFMSAGNKLNVILDLINEDYVDSVNMKNLVEAAIPKLVSELDPHSEYIPADQLKSVNEDLEGRFGGIGIGFVIQNDTVMVVNTIPGGPSEQAGVKPSDRIVTVDNKSFTGKNISNDLAMKNLKGNPGSKVSIGIKRKGHPGLIHLTLKRAEIPVNTILASYVVSPGIGLIKIDKFGLTTYDEFIQAMSKLSSRGCNSYIIDLRGNPGGALDIVVNIVNEFMPDKSLIVYTKGRAFGKEDVYANGTGTAQNAQIAVLTDESSASASEIFAGAIQDNDRGLVLGRRTFGKGLVQKQIDLGDGSALRLTIARYYTPSGRCIQREYKLGDAESYIQDWVNRFSDGEAFSQDSIKQNTSKKYKTLCGRPVYGGGGIMPDLFIPIDTSKITSYYLKLKNENIFYEYAFYYVDRNRQKLSRFKNHNDLYKYLQRQPILKNVTSFAENRGIKKRADLIRISADWIVNVTNAYIIRDLFSESDFYDILMRTDNVVGRAVDILRKGEARPEAIVSRWKAKEAKEKLAEQKGKKIRKNKK